MTTATIRRPSLQEFEVYENTEVRQLVLELLAAKAFAEAEHERVKAYTAPIFAEYEFHPADEWTERLYGTTRARVLTEEELYLTDMTAPAYREYCERVKDAHAAHGWTGPREHCPALVAKSKVTVAENALVKSILKFMGAEGCNAYGETRRKIIELACRSAKI